VSARTVAIWQPIKLAALEGQFATERGAPLRVGGWPDVDAQRTRFAIEIPRGLSLLAFRDPDAEVRGLTAFARENWPPIPPVHLGFQIMVGLGTVMAAVSVWAAVVTLRKRDVSRHRWLLRALAVVAPFGFIATEAGWTVTEVGRQPWIVQGILRTADAVTPMPGLVVPMIAFALLYLWLGAIVITLIVAIVQETM
jgi:cytochrome d ubiquinol oxidase subunit I